MMRTRILTLFFIACCGLAVAQNGLQQPKGEGWLRLGQNNMYSNMYFDSNGDKIMIRTNGLYSTSLQGEYGIFNSISVQFNVPFFVRTTINDIQFNQSGKVEPGRALNSFGDSDIGVQVKLFHRAAFQANGFVTLGLPLGKKESIGTESDLQTGDGEFNQLVGLWLCWNVLEEKLFISGYTSYNNRTKNFSNEIRYGFRVGYTAGSFNVLARLSALETLFNDTAPVSLNSIFSNHREFISPGIEVAYNLSPCFSIYASADFYPAGRNTLATTDVGAGVQVRFR